MEKPSQFSMGQTAQSLTCSIMEKPHTVLNECPRILLACFRAKNSAPLLSLSLSLSLSLALSVIYRGYGSTGGGPAAHCTVCCKRNVPGNGADFGMFGIKSAAFPGIYSEEPRLWVQGTYIQKLSGPREASLKRSRFIVAVRDRGCTNNSHFHMYHCYGRTTCIQSLY